MAAIGGFLKPCYLFVPSVLLRRIGAILSPERAPSARRTVRLPWGARLDVNANEVIGRELVRQNVFDIAVSELAWRLLNPGDRAVDVGANIGYMTSLFAARAGPNGEVIAFEPHPAIFDELQRNVRRIAAANGTARIALHDCALGDRAGTAQLVEPEAFEGNAGTATMAAGEAAHGSSRSFTVKVARLDAVLGSEPVALLKVDVEGFELQVLLGAWALLAAGRIRNVVYEAHEREKSQVHALLQSHGYSIYGVGYNLFGPRITRGLRAPSIDASWESPSYIATLDPELVEARMRGKGWRCLRSAPGRVGSA